MLRDRYYGLVREMTRRAKQQLEAAARDADPVNRFQWFDMTEKQPKLDFLGHAGQATISWRCEHRFSTIPLSMSFGGYPLSLRKQRNIYYKAFRPLSPEARTDPKRGNGVSRQLPVPVHLLGRVQKGVRARLYGRLGRDARVCRGASTACPIGGSTTMAGIGQCSAVKRFSARVLSPERVARCEYLNARRGLQQLLDETQRGERDHVGMIYRLLTHVIWRESLGSAGGAGAVRLCGSLRLVPGRTMDVSPVESELQLDSRRRVRAWHEHAAAAHTPPVRGAQNARSTERFADLVKSAVLLSSGPS